MKWLKSPASFLLANEEALSALPNKRFSFSELNEETEEKK